MKHVTYAKKSLLVDDDAADALIEYARVLADSGSADTVTLRAISPDGNTVDATFLLNASTVLMIESTNSELSAPSNEDITAELRDRIAAIDRPASTEVQSPWIDENRNLGDAL
jgi:hypothetical protein